MERVLCAQLTPLRHTYEPGEDREKRTNSHFLGLLAVIKKGGNYNCNKLLKNEPYIDTDTIRTCGSLKNSATRSYTIDTRIGERMEKITGGDII